MYLFNSLVAGGMSRVSKKLLNFTGAALGMSSTLHTMCVSLVD
jgi:hypothetical protein